MKKNTLSNFFFEEITDQQKSTSPLVNDGIKGFKYQVSITPEKITRFFFLVTLLLLITALFLIVFKYNRGGDMLMFKIFNKLFDLDREGNIPAFFSSLLLLTASLLLMFIYKVSTHQANYWLFLSLLFLFLSVDESVQIHEILNRLKLETEMFKDLKLVYVWIFPYLILIVLLFFFLKRFIFSLPPQTRNLMILSAVIFVGSAMGVEIVHDFLKVINGGIENMYLEFLICLEEIGEMTGTIIFIYTLLTYIAVKKSTIFIGTEN